ncbi:hypothetical protein DLM76_00870 [Leptospira yasudae]|uniref:YcxB family protein n=1 Tax=Leptospira yasudae TaxID=2202201 RepID=UPI000E59AFCD|nr:YcxB family protein [Leptospira yasudae]MBW0432163.1 YcxB family protein [Leptospira yasudae]RHX95579.1 hypothetical protein DLM76_00870 [Leptospira yasudae]TGN02495.1 YcxB family protein [Leptospira yasudae]
MQIVYEITLDDIINFNDYHFRNSKLSRKKRFIVKLIIPIWTVLVFFVLNRNDISGISLLYNIPIFLFAVGWFFFYDRLYFWRLRKNVARMLLEKESKGMIGTHKITLTDDVLTFETSHSSSNFKLGSLTDVVETKEYLFLYVTSLSALIVPLSAFQNSEKEEFLKRIRSFVA